MIVVVFEALPRHEKRKTYFELAASLRLELERIDGFLSIERFESLTSPGKILSLSFWRHEEAVRQWRNLEVHRQAQSQGRTKIFSDYRIRIGEVIRDYGLDDRSQAPSDSVFIHHL